MSDEPIDVDPGQPAPEQPADETTAAAAVAEQGEGDIALSDTAALPTEVVVAQELANTEAAPEDAPPAGEAEPAPAGMPSAELKAVVEALVFASPEPITPKTLYTLLSNESKEAVSAAINELRLDYLDRPGLQLVEVAGGYQITTRPELHDWVRRLFHERSTQKLSAAALESLAVIAYRQPVTALEVTEIRGVNASGVLSTLLERNLIKIVGRKNVVGRPFMYGTTKEFLIRFGLKDLGDLPRIEDMAEALGFDPPMGLVEQTPKDEMLPLEEGDEANLAEEGSPATELAAGTVEQPEEGSPATADAPAEATTPDDTERDPQAS